MSLTMSVLDKLNGKGEDESINPLPDENDSESNNNQENNKNNESTLEDKLQEESGQKISRDENSAKNNEPTREDLIVQLKNEIRNERKSHKAEMREIRQIVTDLTSSLEAEANRKLSKQKIQAFAEKVGADPETIEELATLLKDDINPSQKTKTKELPSKKDEEEDDDEDDEELPAKIDNRRLSLAVDSMINQFLKDMPEYKDVIDQEVVKDLIIANPRKYSKFTMTQIVEKLYPSINGKKGIESPKPQARESSDKKKEFNSIGQKEFKEVLNDPEERRNYRKDLLERARKFAL